MQSFSVLIIIIALTISGCGSQRSDWKTWSYADLASSEAQEILNGKITIICPDCEISEAIVKINEIAHAGITLIAEPYSGPPRTVTLNFKNTKLGDILQIISAELNIPIHAASSYIYFGGDA